MNAREREWLGSGPEVDVFARRLGSGPEVEVFAGKNFTLGPDPLGGLFGDGEDEGGEGGDHGGDREEDARGGAEEGVTGFGFLGLYVDDIVLL